MGATMVVREAEWTTIRHLFSQEERAAMNGARCGEWICPRASVLEIGKMPGALVDKLLRHLPPRKRTANPVEGGGS